MQHSQDDQGHHQDSGGGGATVCPLVLCALEFERRYLAKGSFAAHVEIMRTGPGTESVTSALASIAPELYEPIVFAGLAGSLTHRREVADAGKGEQGQALIARCVTNETGQSWVATWPDASDRAATGLEMVDILGALAPVSTPEGKRQARQLSGADLVDTESHAFAAWAAEMHLPHWGIVRAVSDGADEPLPDGIDKWVRSNGTVNLARMALDLVRRPALVGDLRRIARQTEAAMQAVVALLERLLPAPNEIH